MIHSDLSFFSPNINQLAEPLASYRERIRTEQCITMQATIACCKHILILMFAKTVIHLWDAIYMQNFKCTSHIPIIIRHFYSDFRIRICKEPCIFHLIKMSSIKTRAPDMHTCDLHKYYQWHLINILREKIFLYPKLSSLLHTS